MALSAQLPNGNLPARWRQNALTPAFVRNVDQAGRYSDGNCLYVYVKPTGARSWIQRLVINGRRRDLGLGGFPLVSLREARDRALAHAVMNPTEAAYARSDLFARRRRLMDDWAAYLDAGDVNGSRRAGKPVGVG